MPASMMSADRGDSVVVIGRSIAIVASGPMPGSTPIRVPSRTPMKQTKREAGVSACLKPEEDAVPDVHRRAAPVTARLGKKAAN